MRRFSHLDDTCPPGLLRRLGAVDLQHQALRLVDAVSILEGRAGTRVSAGA